MTDATTIAARIRQAFARNELAQGNCEAIISWAEKGDFGMLFDANSGQAIRPATGDELVASLEAGAEGIIAVDGRDVYVA